MKPLSFRQVLILTRLAFGLIFLAILGVIATVLDVLYCPICFVMLITFSSTYLWWLSVFRNTDDHNPTLCQILGQEK